jgi:DNA-binding response OmpR family regulator
MTQVRHSKQESGLDVGKLKGQQGDLLFVGSGDVFNDELARRVFRGYQLRTISRAMGLPDALKHLESKIVDLVLLGREFHEEDSSRFVLAARRRGFSGLILRVASIPGYKAGGPAALTARERQVLTRVSEGWSNAEIARSLKSSEGAIKGVLQRLFHKLGVRKRAQIVRMAFEKELIDAERNERGRPYGVREVANPLVSPGDLPGREPIRIGHFVVDVAMHRVWVRGVETHLTPKEFGLLAVFVTHPGELVRSITLCEIFWRNPTSKQDALRVLVRALRAKIEVSKTPRYVVTERSFGYRFIPLPSRSGASESDTPVAT